MDRHHCLVTGANRGLGLEFVRQLLARGDHVIAACRQPGKATTLNLLAGEHPGRLQVLPLDLADPRSHAALAAEVPLVTDEEPLDLLINNAGVLRGGERFGQVRPSDLDASFHTNAAGPFLLTQALAPQLAEGATVANISSEVGSIALRQEFRTPSYAMGKAAQNMATSLLAQALAPRGIKVVALHPGWVRTDMGGAQAALSAQESVAGLLRVLHPLTLDQSGEFFDWQGQPLPW
ncbi:SDR family oxidoreductase [Pseudoxanthomonas sp.]|uniref:SDR family oxidoreductase n=1 Tax=Pseudoxanthomonas sp. TaxID=1871049 RepID=UPI003F7CF0EE